MSAPPNAGDSLTAATGGGTTVVDGELGALLPEDALAAGLAVAGAPAWLTAPVVWTAASPEDEPEQAAVDGQDAADEHCDGCPTGIPRTVKLHVVLRSISSRRRPGRPPIRPCVVQDARGGRTLTPTTMITRAARSHRTPRGDSPALCLLPTPQTSRGTSQFALWRIRQPDRCFAQAEPESDQRLICRGASRRIVHRGLGPGQGPGWGQDQAGNAKRPGRTMDVRPGRWVVRKGTRAERPAPDVEGAGAAQRTS